MRRFFLSVYFRLQSTRPVWGHDPFTLLVLLDCHDFNPHAPHGGATCRGASASARAAHFNPRASHGGATRSVPFSSTALDISIHTPRVGRDVIHDIQRRHIVHFNPRARVGRDCSVGKTFALPTISIHAPAWGATVPVYTGLITAVALYFSRTSFLAVLLQAFFVAKSSV